MPKRKTRSNARDGNAMCIWTFSMDDALIGAYLHQQTMGNRVRGTFTTHALENIVNEMKGKFPDKPIDKEKAQNRMKNIKKVFIRCYDIFKNGMSGFTWNPTTEMWNAEPEVWQHLTEVKPEAAEWMNKSIRNYEKLVQLYGQDKATGQHVAIGSEMRGRRVKNLGNTSCDPSSANAIDEIDFMVFHNSANLGNLGENENIDIHDNEVEDEASPITVNQQSQSEAPSSSKSKKVKRSDSRDDVNNLSKAVESVANAIIQSTNAMIQASNTMVDTITCVLKKCAANPDPTKDCDVWAMLMDLGISQPLLIKAYMFLIKDSKMLEGLIRCPNEHRKSLLLNLMGCDHEPHN